MKTTIKILSVEEKTSNKGKNYKRFSTSDGWMSCFETDVSKELIENLGKDIVVNIEERNGFKNITAVLKGLEEIKEVSKIHSTITDNFSDARAQKDQSIYTSYAKDIFITIYNKLLEDTQLKDNEIASHAVMQKAIELVKQAKEAFK